MSSSGGRMPGAPVRQSFAAETRGIASPSSPPSTAPKAKAARARGPLNEMDGMGMEAPALA
eukprot:1273324-Pyramimonas_sp.AAC.1